MNDVVETVNPTTALGVGLKVDSDLVPANVLMTADLDGARRQRLRCSS